MPYNLQRACIILMLMLLADAAMAANSFKLTANVATINAGYTFMITVTAVDSNGGTDTTYTGDKFLTGTSTAISSPNGTNPVIPSGSSTFTGGIASIHEFVLHNATETTTITISDGTRTGTLSMKVIPRIEPPCPLNIITQHNGTETAGVGFSVKVAIIDVYGNTVDAEPFGSITCSFDGATPSPDGHNPNISLDNNIVFASGTASFGTFALYNANETPHIVINDLGFISGTSSPITVIASDPVALKFSAPATVTAGVEFQLGAITLYDTYGNTATTTGTKSVRYNWNTIEIAGTFSTREVSFDHGTSITPLNITLLCATATYITANVDSVWHNSNYIVVLPAPPSSFTLETEHHGSETAGEAFFINITAADKDKFGNTASAYSGSRTINWCSSIVGTLSVTEIEFNHGQGTATGFTLTNTQPTTISAFDAANNICGTTSPITVNPTKQLDHLQIITMNNGTETAGIPFTVKIIVCDQWDNPTEYNGTESIFWSWNAATSTNGIPPALPPSGSYTFKAGSITINGFKLTNAIDTTVIQAQFGTITGSFTIAVSPGSATCFNVIAPALVTINEQFNLSLIDNDICGNTATTYTGTRTLTLTCNGSDTTRDAYFNRGISASSIPITLAEVGIVKISVSYGTIVGTSAAITVKLGSMTCLEVATDHQDTETAGIPFAVILTLKDENSPKAIDYTGSLTVNWSWTVSNSPNNDIPTIPTGSVFINHGIGTVSGFVLTNAALTQVYITIHDNNISGSLSINVVPAEASYFDINLPSPVIIDQPFSIGTLTARDRLGNVAIDYSGTKTPGFSEVDADNFGIKSSYPSAIVFEQGVAIPTQIMPLTITLKNPGSISLSLSDGDIKGKSAPIKAITLNADCMVWPHEVSANGSETINYTVANTGDSDIIQIRIIIPEGFTYINAGTISQLHVEQAWSAAYNHSSRCVILTPSNNGYLSNGTVLSIPIIVYTGKNEQKPIKWSSLIIGKQGGIVPTQEAINGGSEVAITAYSLTCQVSTDKVLLGGAATITASVIYQQTGTPTSGATVTVRVINGQASIPAGTVTTDASGQAYILVTNIGTITETITVEIGYGLFNTQTVSFQVISPIPELSAGKNSFPDKGKIYANPVTPFILTPFGSFTCEYKLDSGNWQRFSQSFTIDSSGEHTVYYRYVDESGHRGGTYTASIFISPIQTTKLTNFPNPFNPLKEETIIQYYLFSPSDVHIQIYNLFGELVWMKNILAGQQETQQIPWDGRNGDGEVVGNGSYICRVTIKYPSGDVVMMRKIGVVK